MKYHFLFIALLLSARQIHAQNPAARKETPVPCSGSADALPGRYTDHTQPKYPGGFSNSYSAQDKAAMTKQLIALEKIEEASRSNFQITGCVARVSFSAQGTRSFGGYPHTTYEYQLAAYRNVCHVTQHIVKTVDEYRTVFRVSVNPFVGMSVIPGAAGEFYLTDKNKGVRYNISIDAKEGPNYEKDRTAHPSRISQYISESNVLTSRSSDYKNKHRDFLRIINGDGYVENWMQGSQYDKPSPTSSNWVDRHYLITKPGLPLLLPVSRKQYLEDLLEYFEIEKANFFYNLESQLKGATGNRLAVLQADKQAYPDFYEKRKAKVEQLLATQKADWLAKPAVVDSRSVTYDAYRKMDNIGKFYDMEDDKTIALYVHNPAYFKTDTDQPTKPLLLEVQFRYELTADYGFSERLFNNFLRNYDLNALKKIIQ